ncbi:VOC family protein [Bacillus marinisedimentorum]|uniref:VOC family protein n=1 Tax=Bacillus marinisedimentorum TaxID=1821260 RepID=UPI0008723329|nr:VOC family protein [Bacillus marinisedimentorum]
MSLFTEVHQINIWVKDIKRSSKWYEEILGVETLSDYGSTVMLNFPSSESTVICLIEVPGDHRLPYPDHSSIGTHPVFAITPEYAETCKETLEEKEVEIVKGGGKAHFKFKDLDGNVLEAYLPGLYEKEEYEHLR